MNKAININISGQLFYINEDAYLVLDNYLKTLSTHFMKVDGGNEIMGDIESRIAEMFKEKLSERNQVLALLNVEEMIRVMGKPEDLIDADFINASESKGGKPEKPLYTSEQKKKHLFRDDDSSIIGGVCSGLGYYFNLDPVWLRAAFVIMLFFFGTGTFLYIILWIIIPRAKSPAEKLEMKGEPVNIGSISKSINEEFDGLKKKINSSNFSQRVKLFTNQVIALFLNIAELLLKFLGKFLGFILITVAMLLLVILTSSLIGGEFIFSFIADEIEVLSFREIALVVLENEVQYDLAKIAFLLVIGMPLLEILTSGIRLLFSIKKKNKILSVLYSSLWVSGLVLLLSIAYFISDDFSVKGSVVKSQIIKVPENDSIVILKLNPSILDSRTFGCKKKKNCVSLKLENEVLNIGNPKIDILRSASDSVEVEVYCTARGNSKKLALDRADKVLFNYSIQDTVLALNPYYGVKLKDKFRAQTLKITIKLPIGKYVKIDRDLEKFLDGVHNFTDTLDEEMAGHTWFMSEEGLKCMDCN